MAEIKPHYKLYYYDSGSLRKAPRSSFDSINYADSWVKNSKFKLQYVLVHYGYCKEYESKIVKIYE